MFSSTVGFNDQNDQKKEDSNVNTGQDLNETIVN